MSKVGDLLSLIRGSHVMGEDGLRDYHCAAAAITRKRTGLARLNDVKKALKNHRVTVTLTPDDKIRVFRADTQQELLL